MHSEKEKPESIEVPSEKFETDSQKLVKLHLENKDHVISEEELKNLRVGIQPEEEEKVVEHEQEERD